MAAPTTIQRLVRDLRAGLDAHADPVRAEGMRAYMKSAMPYLGVQTPAREAVCRDVFARHALPDAATWRAAVLALWRGARVREERYAAIGLAMHRPSKPFRDLDALPVYEELIVTGAWWDYVDTIASHLVGELLRSHPRPMGRTLRRWATDEDMWKRRTAILAQLTFKDATDLDLLYACLEANLGDREFFIRKAIGWALRQLAWTDPGEVRRYVAEHEARLSPLSRREALKNVDRQRPTRARR